MLNWEKEPDNDLLINLILKNPLGRNIELYSFLNLLSNIPSGVSIALDGPWGSGKTFFVKQLEILINNNNSKIPLEAKNQPIVDFIKNEPLKEQLIKDCIAIRYDAWENDSDIDPIFSLVYNIAKEVNMNFTYSGEHDLVRKYILTGATLLQNINQINANDFIDSLLDLHKGNPTNIIASQKEIKQKVDEYFQDVCVHGEKRIIVFIDELDRCSPVFAVRLLERIKHYLSNPKVTFVFSINIDQLQHTIKKYYGEGFDANKYLHRFFYLTVKLPLIDTDKYFQYVGFNKIDTFSIICKKVVEYFNFSLRDLQRFLATSNSNGANLREAYPRSLFANDKAKQFCAYVIVPLLEGIRIDNSTC